MDKKNFYTALILLVFGLFSLTEASKLPFGSLSVPKSGFFSFLLAILLVFLSLCLLGQSLKKNRIRTDKDETTVMSWKKLSLVTGALIAYGLSFEYLGYVLCSFLFIVFLLRVIEPQKWWLVMVISCLVSMGSYLVFGFLLKATLPGGILGI